MGRPKTNPLKSALKRWVPLMLQAQTDNLNEADTIARITRVFENVLGYDPLVEISREAQLKGKYVDLVIKIDGRIRLLVEAKAAGIKLRDRHIEQAEGYAARNNYQWVLLTNGVVWNLYHLTFEQGIEYEQVFSVDLAKDQLDLIVDRLSLISRDSIRKRKHEKYWERQSALSPKVIGKCLFHKDVLTLIRREIRRELGFLVDPEDLATAIQGMMSTEARELIGPPRIRGNRKSSTPKKRPAREESSPGKPKAATSLSAGSALERKYKGKRHVVLVVENGFEYEGRAYRSLTAIAKKITGAKAISGPRFFGAS